MFAVGAGGLDVAMAMAGQAFYLVAPKIIKITITGNLKKWVSAKDVILKVLSIFGTRGNTGYVFEYSGPGLSALSVPERATIANMGAECGVTTSIFPSDESTRLFLQMQAENKSGKKSLLTMTLTMNVWLKSTCPRLSLYLPRRIHRETLLLYHLCQA